MRLVHQKRSEHHAPPCSAAYGACESHPSYHPQPALAMKLWWDWSVPGMAIVREGHASSFSSAVKFDGLDQVVIEPSLFRAAAIFVLSPSGQGDNLHAARTKAAPECDGRHRNR